MGEGRLQICTWRRNARSATSRLSGSHQDIGGERPSARADLAGHLTAIEAGFPSLEVEGLVGLFGPRSMPNELREKIGADVKAVAADPEIAAKLAGTAQVVNPGGPAEFAAAVEEQRAKIANIAQALGIKPKQQ